MAFLLRFWICHQNWIFIGTLSFNKAFLSINVRLPFWDKILDFVNIISFTFFDVYRLSVSGRFARRTSGRTAREKSMFYYLLFMRQKIKAWIGNYLKNVNFPFFWSWRNFILKIILVMNNRETTQPPFIAQFASGKPQNKYLIFYIQTKF